MQLREELRKCFPYGHYEVNGEAVDLTKLWDDLVAVAKYFGASVDKVVPK